MKVLLFGGRGFMGQQFLQIYPDAVVPSADIADPAAVAGVLDREKPDVVINAAGKTGTPNVDWCEDHKLETMHANVLGPIVLAEECGKRGIYWVHLSSGCIYEGDNGGRGFAETDETNFTGSFYSRSKALCERAIREFPGILILRLRMPFDGSSHPKNLITKLAKYARVNDEENSITCLTDFLEATKKLIERRATGIYNMVNEGTISPYRIMELYREIVDSNHRFERLPFPAQSQVTKVGRSNCILATGKLKGEGIQMRPIEDAVKSALLEFKKSSSAK
ncbi:MAG: sugar nucleotide-binding protein [Candidatus Peribacteraceae bacterium]|nr:sugar nucleotide-binding protein [Candidatus Peribacteraceae bacterium]